MCGFGCAGPLYKYNHSSPPLGTVGQVIPVYIDSAFDNVQTLSIMAAIREWNTVLNGQIKLDVVKKFNGDKEGSDLASEAGRMGIGWVIAKLNDDHPVIERIDLPSNILAFVPHDDAHLLVVIGNRLATRNLKLIAMHEMGHLLGAVHVPGGTLMGTTYENNRFDCIDKVTAYQVARRNELDFQNMNYCSIPEFR